MSIRQKQLNKLKMKKVTINRFEFFVNSNLNLIKLMEWLEVELHNPFNVFELNESYSCMVSLNNGVITISGDCEFYEVVIEEMVLLDFSGSLG